MDPKLLNAGKIKTSDLLKANQYRGVLQCHVAVTPSRSEVDGMAKHRHFQPLPAAQVSSI
jgi:hypothetical protein